jgi:hypothetical protein
VPEEKVQSDGVHHLVGERCNSSPRLGALVGKGFTADIFAWERGRVVKLVRVIDGTLKGTIRLGREDEADDD